MSGWVYTPADSFEPLAAITLVELTHTFHLLIYTAFLSKIWVFFFFSGNSACSSFLSILLNKPNSFSVFYGLYVTVVP